MRWGNGSSSPNPPHEHNLILKQFRALQDRVRLGIVQASTSVRAPLASTHTSKGACRTSLRSRCSPQRVSQQLGMNSSRHRSTSNESLTPSKGACRNKIVSVSDSQFVIVGSRGITSSDWGGDLDNRLSTSVSINMIAGGPVAWKSKLQRIQSHSSVEWTLGPLHIAGGSQLHLINNETALSSFRFYDSTKLIACVFAIPPQASGANSRAAAHCRRQPTPFQIPTGSRKVWRPFCFALCLHKPVHHLPRQHGWRCSGKATSGTTMSRRNLFECFEKATYRIYCVILPLPFDV